MLSMILLLAAAPPAAAPADPLAPARAGQVQCYAPNPATKTCRSIATYRVRADGTIENGAELMIAPDPLIVLATASTVAVKDGGVCGSMHASETAAARITLNGAPMPEAQAAQLRQAIDGALGGFYEREVCTTYEKGADGGLVARGTLDGKAMPELNQPVMWVSPADGWKVGP